MVSYEKSPKSTNIICDSHIIYRHFSSHISFYQEFVMVSTADLRLHKNKGENFGFADSAWREWQNSSKLGSALA